MYDRIMHNSVPRFLTDLELACKTKSFDVHKLVISSVSQYFREILAKDPGMKRLELPSLSPLGKALTCSPSLRSPLVLLCSSSSQNLLVSICLSIRLFNDWCL